jgi:peptidylprolyl isomerase
MTVEAASRVKLAFTATYPDGELFDTSSSDVAAEHGVEADKRFRPVAFTVGERPTIRSLEEGLLGVAVGETRRIEVPHEDLRVTYDRDAFESMVEGPVETGLRVHAATGLLGEVVCADAETVTVDFDPERAGETLTFEVEVLAVE